MRSETPLRDRWEWWERAVSGAAMPAITERQLYEDVHCGFFKVRRFRHADYAKADAPWLPARVWVEGGDIDPETGMLLSDEKWRAEIDGKQVNLWKTWHRIRTYPISEEEWRWLTALSPLTMKKLPQKR